MHSSAAAELAAEPGTIASASALRCSVLSRNLATRRRSPSARRRIVQTRACPPRALAAGRRRARSARMSPLFCAAFRSSRVPKPARASLRRRLSTMPAAADHSHWSAAVGIIAYPPSDRKRSRAWRASASSRSSASGGATSSSATAGSVTSGATQRSSAQRPHCAASLPYAQRRSDRLSPPAAFRTAAVRAAEPALSRLRAAAARWWPRWSACGGRPPRASPCVVCVAGRRYQHGTNAARSTSGAQRCAAVAARCPCLRAMVIVSARVVSRRVRARVLFLR